MITNESQLQTALNPRHNYNKKLTELIAQGRINAEAGAFNQVEIRHDDWCDLYADTGDFCNCDPEVIVLAAENTCKGAML